MNASNTINELQNAMTNSAVGKLEEKDHAGYL